MALELLRTAVFLTFVGLGSIGNTLSFITVTNKFSQFKYSYKVYLAALAVSDTLVLYSSLFQALLSGILEVTILPTQIYCKLQAFSSFLFTCVSAWLIALLASERAFCVFFPHKVRAVCKPKTGYITTGLLVTFFLAFNSHYIYGIGITTSINRHNDSEWLPLRSNITNEVNSEDNIVLPLLFTTEFSVEDINEANTLQPFAVSVNWMSRSNHTTHARSPLVDNEFWDRTTWDSGTIASEKLSDIMNTTVTPVPFNFEHTAVHCALFDEKYGRFFKWWIWIDFVVYYLGPVCVIIAANTAIWIKVNRSGKELSSTFSNLAIRRSRHVIILTTLISAAYIICVTPIAVFVVVEAILIEDKRYDFEASETGAVLRLIAFILILSNHSFNFFLYVLSGRHFRRDLATLFCKQKQSNVTPQVFISIQPMRKTNHTGAERNSRDLLESPASTGISDK